MARAQAGCTRPRRAAPRSRGAELDDVCEPPGRAAAIAARCSISPTACARRAATTTRSPPTRHICARRISRRKAGRRACISRAATRRGGDWPRRAARSKTRSSPRPERAEAARRPRARAARGRVTRASGGRLVPHGHGAAAADRLPDVRRGAGVPLGRVARARARAARLGDYAGAADAEMRAVERGAGPGPATTSPGGGPARTKPHGSTTMIKALHDPILEDGIPFTVVLQRPAAVGRRPRARSAAATARRGAASVRRSATAWPSASRCSKPPGESTKTSPVVTVQPGVAINRRGQALVAGQPVDLRLVRGRRRGTDGSARRRRSASAIRRGPASTSSAKASTCWRWHAPRAGRAARR